LLFVVFVDFEVFLGEVVDVGAFFVGDYGIDEDETGVGADDGVGVYGLLVGSLGVEGD
jgi:hypothetical protein